MKTTRVSVLLVTALGLTWAASDAAVSAQVCLMDNQQVYRESFPGQHTYLPNKASVSANLPWPVAGKSIKDISLYFWVEDAVSPGVSKNCKRGACGYSGSTEDHFPYHLGVDIAAASGSKVTPVQSGKVERVGDFGGGWGQYVVVSHDNNTWTSLYGHLDIDSTKIYKSLVVTTSTTLGTVRDLDPKITGDIDHLHFGLRAASYNDTDTTSRRGIADCSWTDPKSFVNPLSYLSRKDARIVDDNDTTRSGSWQCSNSVDFYYGTGYRVLAGGSAGSATFQFAVPSDGSYKIYSRWTPHSNRTEKAVFYLSNGASTVAVTKNQQTIARGSWVELSTVTLTMAKPFTVKLTNGSSSGYLVADAILIAKQ
ncbi:MAG TPA: peptidoglycan DD-metalloendopeptidase family protein [Thermoanaerobaculia bacterium]|nr:peptidoglycan DD-metalloendopeptidase family protein [Thermoanaerobaculia bacterium]